MSVTPSSTIVGIFTDRSLADQAMQALYNAGFTHEQIRYVVPGASGGILEDIKSLFTGTSTGGGNLAHDLTSMGLSDEEAGYYANEYNTGKIILAVSAQGREQDAVDILHQYGAYHSQTRSGSSSYETPNDVQQPSTSTQQGNYAPYEAPSQQEVGQNWPVQPVSHTPEEHAFEDHQQDRVTPEASTEDQTAQPVTSGYDSEASSTQANRVTPESATGDQASQTGTTAPEYSTNYQTAQSEMASPQTDTEDQTPQDSQAASESETEMQTSPSDVAAPEQDAENQSAPSDVAAYPETDYQAQQPNAATSESWTDYQAPQISAVTSVEEVEEQTTPSGEVPFASPADDAAPQANAVTTEQEVGTQASQPDQNTSGHVDELQQLLEQLQATQQQLQEAKAQLQAAKDHEAQLQTAREREQQLQTARQQLQDMQAELQATLAELRETQARIEHYQ
ncbi:MAG TPA: hypothetical protein VF043_23740 [Ktedonobacteraceae bacterium]